MGFLYSYAVTQDGSIPTKADFIAVRDKIIAKFREAKEQGVVEFAGVFGSVIPEREDHTRRSDMDVFVVYPTEAKRRHGRSLKRARQLLRDVRIIGHKHHVIVDTHCIPHYSAVSGRHPFGPSFKGMWHVLHKQGMLVGNPDALARLLMIPKGRTVRQEMETRVPRNLRRAIRHERQFAEQDKRHPRNPDPACENAMRRCVRPLHTYLNLARKMLWWQDGVLPDHRKKPVFEAFAKCKEFERMHASFEILRKTDIQYDALLAKALAKEIGESDYHDALYEIMTRTLRENIILLRAAVAHMDAQRLRRANGKANGQAHVTKQIGQERSRRDRLKAVEA